MSLNDFADTFFTSKSITYTDPETNICKLIPSKMFHADKSVEYRQITIPANTTDNFHLYQFGDNEHVENLYNVRIGRLSEPEDLTYAIGTTYALVANYNHAANEILTAAIHGDGVLFDTEAAEKTVIMEVSVVNKASTYLEQELRDAIKFLYYYLYTEDIEKFYSYMRRLAVLKKNKVNENTKTKVSRKIYNSTFVPLQL